MPNATISKQARQRARKRLSRQGLSVRAWADQHQLKPGTVYEVLAGRKRCLRGDAHRAAVLLGLKKGLLPPSAASAAGVVPVSRQ